MTGRALHRRLAALRAVLGRGEVVAGVSSLHGGWRVWVRLGPNDQRLFRSLSEWAMWPEGCSLGAGATLRSALASAAEHAPDLARILDPTYPEAPTCSP